MAMIKHWLHEQPSSNFGRFTSQAAQAAWLERRYWDHMGKTMGVESRG